MREVPRDPAAIATIKLPITMFPDNTEATPTPTFTVAQAQPNCKPTHQEQSATLQNRDAGRNPVSVMLNLGSVFQSRTLAAYGCHAKRGGRKLQREEKTWE